VEHGIGDVVGALRYTYHPLMDWFERITGFAETDWHSTRERLAVEGADLVSLVNGTRHGVGSFEVPTLSAMRARARRELASKRTLVECVVGDTRALHVDPRFAGATFQVASQFNALEMVSPDVTPEDGVTRYAFDRTQGPACAIAAGAATIWRNYFLPWDSDGRVTGQTATRQLDTLAGLGTELANRLGAPVQTLWSMRNGYALATAQGLQAIGRFLNGASEDVRDTLRGKLAVAWQRDAEVTDRMPGERPRVSQVFCSALPVAYTSIAPVVWEPLARLVLEAAYEATLLAAAEQHVAGGSRTVLLTRLGGGVFGNRDVWIDDAILRALPQVADDGLDVKLVSFGHHHPSFRRIAAAWPSGD
jgi:hypothetical protein